MKFQGGYTFKGFSGLAEAVLTDLPVPGTIELPLQSGGIEFTPTALAGTAVRAGEPVLESSGGRVLSPANGTVSEITTETLILETDGTATFTPVEGHPREPRQLSHNELAELYRMTGCSLLSSGRFDTAEKCAAVKHVIVNAAANGPLNRTFAPGIFGDAGVFTNGLKTLGALFPNAAVTVAVNSRNSGYFNGANVKIVPDTYPQEHPEVLSRAIADTPLTSPVGELDSTVAVFEFTAAIQIAETMTQGRPLIDRIVTIAGDGVSKPGWYRVRIGTPVASIVRELVKQDGDWRIIRGDVFSGTGLETPEGSVMPDDSAISVIEERAKRELFNFVMPKFAGDSYSRVTAAEYIRLVPKKLDTNTHGGVRPCVQCNYCDEVCPVGIYPFLIWKHVQADLIEESFRLRPYDCIACGLCDYVCPSKIDIMSSVIQAADTYKEMKGADDETD